MPMRRGKNEDGFTMIATVLGLSLVATLVLVAVTSVNGDSHLTSRDLVQKKAYEAAKAGIDDYAYHLHANNSYWTSCANVTGPTAVNLAGKTEKRLTVPGDPSSEYAIELLPSTSQSTYQQCDENHATESMLQTIDPLKGTFRIRSTGYAGTAEESIVATFKPASFLDYVYFTQRETADPVTYGTSSMVEAAEKQCSKTIAEKRQETEILKGKGYCSVIRFVTGDFINGPMHTNDAYVICGSPKLGGSAADPIEASGPPPGWFSEKEIPNSSKCVGSDTNFEGTLAANSAVLTPPASNGELSTIAEPQFRFKGQVRICLSGESMTVMPFGTTATCANPPAVPIYSGQIPGNGVVYVESGSCPSGSKYTPFNLSYAITTENLECGNAYVEGTYSGKLTIATYNDIIVTGNLCAESCSNSVPLPGEAVLGLVANNFVRIYHPVELKYPQTLCEWKVVSGKWKEVCVEDPSKPLECTGNAPGALNGVTIDAAILAIIHSIIVDNYNCGAQLGTLTVNGALAQKYRGAVGTGGGSGSGTGYLKSYNYDSRLRYIEPPSFIAPQKTAWVIGRETLD